MTPDTAEFPKTGWPTTAWTEDEDGLIETVSTSPYCLGSASEHLFNTKMETDGH